MKGFCIKKVAFVVLVLASLFTLSSCEIITWFWNGTMDKVMLSGQKSLYLNESSSSRAVGDGWLNPVISTIDEQNAVSKLMLGDGKKVFSQDSFELTPIAVTDYGKDYFTIRFDPLPAIYLVNKNNGKAMCINMVGNNPTNYARGVWDIWFDGKDSVYLRTAHLFGEKWQWLEVRKGSLSTGKISAISPARKSVFKYAVDSTGMVICLVDPNNDKIYGSGNCNFSQILEIYPDGKTKTYQLSGDYPNSIMFTDQNDCFWISSNHKMTRIRKVDGTYVLEDFDYNGSLIVNPRFYGNNAYYRAFGFTRGDFELGEPEFKENREPCEIHWFDCDMCVDHVLDLGGFHANQIEKEGDYLYALGNIDGKSSILKIDPRDNSYEIILESDIFDIRTMTISDAQGMVFEGTRIDTGENVVGYRDENTGYLQDIISYSNEIRGLTKLK